MGAPDPAGSRRDLRSLVRSRSRPPISSRTARVQAPHRTKAAQRVLYNQLSNALEEAAASHARGRLVDVGCGTKPWAAIFAPHVTEHVGVDHAPGDGVDVVAGAYEVPLGDGAAGTVLMTEVLEHLEEPVRALEEARRLLEPGGALIVTTPLLFPLHEEPRDFFRYSPFGLEHVLRRAGFESVAVRPLSGQWTTLAMLRGLSLEPYRRGPLLTALVDAYSTVASTLAVRLDELHFRPGFSWNHIATARKPSESAR
ncbi:MAG TPA: class I SAM-dependent methyltransferase [Thermoleophilaceae bacterium]